MLDQLSSASGELSTSRPGRRADGPGQRPRRPARAGSWPAWCSPRSAGIIGRAVLHRLVAAAAAAAPAAGRAGPAGPPGDAGAAAQLVLPGLLLPARVRQGDHGSSGSAPGSWAGTGTSGWRVWSPRGGRCATSGTGPCCSASASPRCTWPARMRWRWRPGTTTSRWRTVAVMLPMLPSTMQVGGVSSADVSLEQMLAAVPDLDDLVARLRDSGHGQRRGPRRRAAGPGHPVRVGRPTATRAAARPCTRAWIWS